MSADGLGVLLEDTTSTVDGICCRNYWNGRDNRNLEVSVANINKYYADEQNLALANLSDTVEGSLAVCHLADSVVPGWLSATFSTYT
jgi:hypothetical protein